MIESTRALDTLSMKAGKGILEELYPHVNMHFQLYDFEGKLKQEVLLHNLVTPQGKELIIDNLLTTPTLGKPTHVGLGTGTPGSTALGSEFTTGYARQGFVSKTRSGSMVTMITDFPPGVATGAITEAGTFNALTSGIMIMSAYFAPINKGSSDLLTLTWTLTIS